MMKNIVRQKNGSVLIEAIVGLSLIVLSFGGIVALISRGLRLNADTLNKFVAVNLATEGIEIMKGALDYNLYKTEGGWNTIESGLYEVDYTCDNNDMYGVCVYFPAGGRSTRLLKKSQDGFYSYRGDENTPFTRSVIVEKSNHDIAHVYSIVEWMNQGTKELVQISDTFTNWRKNPK